MPILWETVYIFISSTFKDMHAERDYLVKRVFPQLNEWCEKRKLRLVDIDLRWGVTEHDAQNRNVIKVCLDRIDTCRPFFLCFLGQRRGWVPRYRSENADENNDIPDSTIIEFPNLKKYAGFTSVTELEILHALIDPLHRGIQHTPEKPGEYYEPTEFAFFYLRDGSYLEQISSPELREIYTNNNAEDDQELNKWRNENIPASGRPNRVYCARWDSNLNTPELGSPGRLTDFQYQSSSLDKIILEDLKAAISARYPHHVGNEVLTALQKEIDQQGLFLFSGSEGFISRGDDFKELNDYVDGPLDRLFILTAPAGMGKSTYLAKWIEIYSKETGTKTQGETIHYRFIGKSDRSTTVNSLLYFLVSELKEIAGKISSEIPIDPQKLRQEFPKLLESAGKKGKTIIILDALDQLDSGLSELEWLPYQLPPNIRLIISFKSDSLEAKNILQQAHGQTIHSQVVPFDNVEDRRKLVNEYLKQYLKALDESHLKTLIHTTGAESPLFLKVILTELRVFGAFEHLQQKISSDFGETPITAFHGVLNRLEHDAAHSPIDPNQAVPLIFGLLAHSRQGLSVDELTSIMLQVLTDEGNIFDKQDVQDTVQLYFRQMRPFLAYRDGCYDFFYESFRLAAQKKYTESAAPQRSTKEWHALLGLYFYNHPFEILFDGNLTLYKRKISEQVYHLALAAKCKETIDTLTDFKFIHSYIQVLGAYQFCDEFRLLDLPDLKITSDENKNLLMIRDAIQLSAHVIDNSPDELANQLIGRLQSQKNPQVTKLIINIEQSYNDRPWLYPEKVKLNTPGGAFVSTIEGGNQGNALVCTPNKRIIALATEEYASHSVEVWDVDQAKQLRKIDGFSNIALAPDGSRAAIFVHGKSDQDNKIGLQVVDIQTGIELKSFSDNTGKVVKSAFAPDGTHVVWVSHHGTLLKYWDRVSGKLIRSFSLKCLDEFKQLSADRLLVLCAESYTPPKPNSYTPKSLYLIDLTTGDVIYQFNQTQSFATTTDGEKIITHFAKSINVWNTNTLTIEIKKDFPELTIINSLEVTPDNKKLIAACSDGHHYIWDLETLSECGHFQSENRLTIKECYALSLDASKFLRGVKLINSDDVIEIWDIKQSKLVNTFRFPNEHIKKIQILLDGSRVGIFSKVDKQDYKGSPTILHIVDISSGAEIKTFTAGNLMAITPDERYFVSAYTIHEQGVNKFSKFSVWDVENDRELPGLTGVKTEYIDYLSISDDGKNVITGNMCGQEIRMWTINSGEEVNAIEGLFAMNSLSFSPCSRYIVTDSDSYRIAIWDVQKETIVNSCDSPVPEFLHITQSSNKIVLQSKDGSLYIWDVKLPEEAPKIFKVGEPDTRFLFAISSNDKKLFVFHNRQCVVWDIDTKIMITTSTKAHDAFAITDDGKFILRGIFGNKLQNTEDKLVLFDYQKDENPIELHKYTNRSDVLKYLPVVGSNNISGTTFFPKNCDSICFTPDRKFMVSIDSYGVDIWDLTSGLIKQSLPLPPSKGGRKLMAVSNDSSRLYIRVGNSMQVWSLEKLLADQESSGKQESELAVREIIILPDSEKALTKTGRTVKLIGINDLNETYSLDVPGSRIGPRQPGFIMSEDRNCFIAGGTFHLEIHKTTTGEEIFRIEKTGYAAISRNKKFAIVEHGDNIEKWDLELGQECCRISIQKQYQNKLRHVTDDGTRAILGSPTDCISIFDLERGQELCPMQGKLLDDGMIGTQFLLLDTSDGLQAWDIQEGKLKWSKEQVYGSKRILPGEQRFIVEQAPNLSVFDLSDGEKIVTLDEMGRLVKMLPDGKHALFDIPRFRHRKIYNLDDFTEQVSLEGNYENSQNFFFSQNNQFVYSCEAASNLNSTLRIRVWDVHSGKLLDTMTMDHEITAFDTSPDGSSVLVGDVLGQLHLFKLKNIPFKTNS